MVSSDNKKQNLYLYFIAIAEGISVMAVELCSAQIISPYYGNNLAVWTTVLGITLIALTSGYFSGGKLAQKNIQQSVFGWLILIAALLIVSIPLVANNIISLLDSLSWQTGWTLLSLLVIFPSLFILGTIPPVLIHFLSINNQESGKISGKVFTVSTIGNIFSAFLLGFFLLPEFGVSVAVFLTALLLAAFSLKILSQEKKINYLLVCGIILLTGTYNIFGKKIKQPDNYKIHEFSEGLLGQVAVIDIPSYNNEQQIGWNRMLLNNRIGQTYINLQNQLSWWSYVNYISSLSSIYTAGSKVLLMGLGGGTLAKILSEQLQFQVTAIELDARMEMFAKKYFDLPKNSKIIIDDARHYIKNEKAKYQIIIMDTYKGDTPPSHLSTFECFSEVKKILAADGILIINFYGFTEGKNGRTAKSIVKTLRQCGLETFVIPTLEEEKYRNMLIVASQKNLDFSNPRATLNILDKPANINSLKLKFSEQELSAAQILTDNQPIQEFWSIEPAQIWRKNYYENFTKEFLQNGVPLFK